MQYSSIVVMSIIHVGQWGNKSFFSELGVSGHKFHDEIKQATEHLWAPSTLCTQWHQVLWKNVVIMQLAILSSGTREWQQCLDRKPLFPHVQTSHVQISECLICTPNCGYRGLCVIHITSKSIECRGLFKSQSILTVTSFNDLTLRITSHHSRWSSLFIDLE